MPTNAVKQEILRKFETVNEIIAEAKKLVSSLEDTNPEVVNHLVDVIEKQSQLMDLFVTEAKLGKPTETPDIDNKLFSILGDYQKLKREEIKAKIAGLDIQMAEHLRNKLNLDE